MIDVVDLVAVIVAWGSDGSQNNSDITGDGVVDVADLVAVIVAWGPIDCGSNGPPVADAGPDQFLVDRNEDGVEQILLDGSASTDDGLIVAYEWAEDGVLLGSGVVVEVALAVGEHAITLTVTDDEELSDSDLIHVTVAAPLQPQAPRSDDFSQSILDPAIWTYIDPLGDAGLEILGTGTSDAVVQICVPEGVTHDAATLNNAAPRIMQAIGDVDFEVEVKFESEPLLQTQIQGIFIEQDAANFQRFDFFSDGSSLRVFAASFAEDVQITRINQAIPAGLPLFMRVQRQGNQWSQLYSTDGLAWTQAVSFAHSMQVVSVGVLAGNAVTDPAYTAIIDYFFNTAAPVLPEDPIFPGPPILSDIQIQSGFTSALVTWSTNEPANGTVRYGLSEALELGEVADEALVYSHAAVITGLLPDSTYHLRIESIDSEGLMAASDVVAFQTSDSSSNQSPTAVAGSDQVLIDGDGNGIESMTLDGSGSADPEAGILEYKWTLNGIEIASGATPVITLPLGAHLIALTVTDEALATATDSVLVTVGSIDPTRTVDGLEAFYLFDETGGDVVLDQAGVADPIDLTIGDSEAVEWTDGGLIVSSPTLISSGQPATRLVEACQTSNEISIEAWVRPAVADQPGPARLVTLSADSLSRNFTLAQGSGASIGDVFEVRLRTSETSDNGLPALVSTSGTASTELTHVFYTRDATGQARLFVNGVQESTGLRGGDLSNWDPTMLLGLAQEQNGLAPWLGEFRLVAIYAAALSPDEVLQNFQVGPGDALLSDLQVDVTEDSAVLSWTTSEPATSRVAYGRSGDYELGTVIDESLTTSHVITLEGLEPGRIHYYEVQSITGSGDPITRGNLIFQTYGGAGSGGPSIDVWYGGSQTFGQIGIPQVWVNILGNVADLDGVSSLSYRLNGGVEQPLSLGPDTRRLQDAGDFNIDLLFDELLPGINLVEVTGLDDLGNESVQTVSVHNASGAVWPIPFDVDWSSVSAIEDTAQVVDGLWAIGPEGLSPVLPGYDRIVVIGDVSWTDYEVTVPITLEGIDPRGYFPPSLQPAVGLGVRWHGHIDNGTQPAWAFTAFSGLGAYLLVPGSPKLALYEHPFVLSDSIPFQISLGVTYLWKMRVETLPEGQRHTLKVWIEGEAEPEEWMLTVTDTDAAAPLSGSLMLLAHHVEATFGNLSVVPLAP